MKNLITTLLLSTALVATVSAQSIYPGQHNGKMKVRDEVPCEALSFDLKDVRLLPGRVHDNLMRDSVWMTSIDVNRLVHSFRNNAGINVGGNTNVPYLFQRSFSSHGLFSLSLNK